MDDDLDPLQEGCQQLLRSWFKENNTQDTILYQYMLCNVSAKDTTLELLKQWKNGDSDSSFGGQTTPNNLVNLTDFLSKELIPLACDCYMYDDSIIPLLEQLKAEFGPTFKSALSGALDQEWAFPRVPYVGEARQAIHYWLDLNVFIGHVHKSNVQDLSSYALSTLNMAWRKSGWPVYRGDDQNGEECIGKYPEYPTTTDDVRVVDGHLIAAATLTTSFGRQFYLDCEDIREKWPTWKDNLEWIVQQEGIDYRVRKSCQEALDFMWKPLHPV